MRKFGLVEQEEHTELRQGFGQAGSGSHPIHRKRAVSHQFRPGRRSWYCYWRVQSILVELGFGYERLNGDKRR